MTTVTTDKPAPKYDYVIIVWYVVLHAATIGGLWLVPFTTEAAVVFAVSYCVRMFGLSAGYHRYFGHRSFKTTRTFQLILAILAMTTVQRGVLWWASWHRHHHRFADQEGDTHSPIANSFFWSYCGWLMSSRHMKTESKSVKDFSKYPELWWLDRHYYLPPALLAGVMFAVGGVSWLYWGFFASTALLFHAMGIGNTCGHWWGPRPYDTADNSHDNVIYLILTLGEYHNSHHHCMTAANQGLVWWKPDLIYWGILALAKLGIVWDVCQPRSSDLTPRQRRRTSRRVA